MENNDPPSDNEHLTFEDRIELFLPGEMAPFTIPNLPGEMAPIPEMRENAQTLMQMGFNESAVINSINRTQNLHASINELTGGN